MIELTPIKEHSYSFEAGFTLLARKKEGKFGDRQIDWDKIISIINSKKFDKVEVGLAEDWEQTYATIFKDGEIAVQENSLAGFYGASRWATPAVKLIKGDKEGLYECWISGTDPLIDDRIFELSL